MKRNKIVTELPIQYREIQIRKEDVNKEDRTIELTFSSEFKVVRQGYFGDSWIEILDHNEKSVDLSRIRAGGPLLVMHDRSQQVGVITSAEIQDKKGRATAKFGRSQFATEIFNDVVDEIRTSVSVGYVIHEVTLEVERDDGPDEYRITKWEPIEISLEPTPADYSIGVGRNNERPSMHPVKIINKNQTQNERNYEMKKFRIPDPENMDRTIEVDENDPRAIAYMRSVTPEPVIRQVEDPPAPATAPADFSAARDKEITRVNTILDIGRRLKIDQRVIDDAVRNPKISVEEFNRTAWSAVDARAAANPGIDNLIDTDEAILDLSNRDISNYSLLRAIRAAIKNDWSKAGFEQECSREIEKMFGREAEGFFVPHDILVRKNVPVGVYGNQKREISTSSGGTGTVGTAHLAGNFIELLRNRSAVTQLGAFMLTGLTGNVAIPKQTGAATAYWVTEGSDVTTSDSAYGQVTLSPKTVGAETPYTRQMLLQSNPSIEALVMNDLINVISLAVDNGALNGSAASGQPRGVKNQSGVGSVTGTSLGWDAVVEFETDVAAANADIASMAYLTNATVNGLLKTRAKIGSTYPVFLVENGQMNGYPVKVSNQVAAANMFFGVWSQLVIGMWGALDILVDPYTNAKSGGVIIHAFQSVDIAVRHAAAFSVSTSIT